MAVNDSTRIVPVGTDPNSNPQPTAYQPADRDIVQWQGQYRLVLLVSQWFAPMAWIGCFNEWDGFSEIEIVSPDELTPVGLAVL